MIDSWGTVHFNKKPCVKRKRETFPNRAYYYSLCFRMTNKLSEFHSRIPNILWLTLCCLMLQEIPYKFKVAVLIEYIRSLSQREIPVQVRTLGVFNFIQQICLPSGCSFLSQNYICITINRCPCHVMVTGSKC